MPSVEDNEWPERVVEIGRLRLAPRTAEPDQVGAEDVIARGQRLQNPAEIDRYAGAWPDPVHK
jgi:hypothetical protein